VAYAMLPVMMVDIWQFLGIEKRENQKLTKGKCTGCAMCMQVCPVDAIKMKENLDSNVHYFAERR